jgi:hypothetical protein
MPQVPLYDGPQVRTQALQPVFQRAPDVSSGAQALARGIGQVTEELDRKIVRDAQDEAFKLELQVRQDWQAERARLREQYKGELADQYQGAAAEWWKKAPETYGKSASPMARTMATKSIGQYMVQAEADTLGYVETEKRKTREINFRTLQSDIVREAGQIVTPENARVIAERDAKRVYDNAIAYAAREGFNSDVGKAMAREQLDRFHVDVALSLASKPGGAKAAQDYLAEFGKEIPLAARTRVDEVVKGEADNQFATQFAASLATKPFSEQLAEAAKIEDPARREKTLTQIRNNQAMVKAAQQEREAAVSDQAWQLVGQGKKVPEALLAQMDGKGRVQLQDYVKEKAKQAAAGTQVKTDWATYIDAREKLAAGEKVNLVALTTKIAPAQMEQLLDIQNKTKTPSKAPEVATSEQQLGAFTRTLDLKGDNLGKFQSAAYDLFNEHLKRTGKEPTYDERDKILRDLNREIVTKPGFLWDTKEPAFKADREVRNKALGVGAAPAAAGPVRIATEAEWARLPKGTVYIDPQGNQRTKQ